MRLELGPEDLDPKYQIVLNDNRIGQTISTEEVEYSKLNDAARIAVQMAGSAIFIGGNRKTRKVIDFF